MGVLYKLPTATKHEDSASRFGNADQTQISARISAETEGASPSESEEAASPSFSGSLCNHANKPCVSWQTLIEKEKWR